MDVLHLILGLIFWGVFTAAFVGAILVLGCVFYQRYIDCKLDREMKR